jgi:hypothetical protein
MSCPGVFLRAAWRRLGISWHFFSSFSHGCVCVGTVGETEGAGLLLLLLLWW